MSILNKSNCKIIGGGDDTINFFYKCLRIGWQSGVSFSESRLTSWDPDHQDMWIRPMPERDDIHFDVIHHENIHDSNLVLFDSLSDEMKKLREEDGSLIEKGGIKYVANFGLGSRDIKLTGYESVKFNCWYFENEDEDMEQETFADWFLGSFPEGTQIYQIISLRGAESFERFTILKQSEYKTGEYARIELKSKE